LVPITRIGTVSAQRGLLLTHHGQPYALNMQGYQHF
jgi:thiamine monophosphate kinase